MYCTLWGEMQTLWAGWWHIHTWSRACHCTIWGTWKTEQCISYQKEKKGCDLWLRIVPAVSCRGTGKEDVSCNHLLSGERLWSLYCSSSSGAFGIRSQKWGKTSQFHGPFLWIRMQSWPSVYQSENEGGRCGLCFRGGGQKAGSRGNSRRRDHAERTGGNCQRSGPVCDGCSFCCKESCPDCRPPCTESFAPQQQRQWRSSYHQALYKYGRDERLQKDSLQHRWIFKRRSCWGSKAMHSVSLWWVYEKLCLFKGI